MTLAKNIQTVTELAQLKPRWYGEGEGMPIHPEVIEKTLRILHKLAEYQPWVYPTIDGNIQLEYEGIDKLAYLEFLIKKDTIEQFSMSGTVMSESREVNEDKILSTVEAFYVVERFYDEYG